MAKSYAELHDLIRRVFDTAGISRGIYVLNKNKLQYIAGKGVKAMVHEKKLDLKWSEKMTVDMVEAWARQIQLAARETAA